MDIVLRNFVIFISISYCSPTSLREQLERIARRRQDNPGLNYEDLQTRRFNNLEILRAPSRPSDLPPAEPILPGHTLLRPAMGMLKSAVKFPHRDPDNGAWVYGNIDNLGIRYGGRDDRVLYSGFRRMFTEHEQVAPVRQTENKHPRVVVLVVPNKNTDFTLDQVLSFLQNTLYKRRSPKKQDINIDRIFIKSQERLADNLNLSPKRFPRDNDYYGLDELIRRKRNYIDERSVKRNTWLEKQKQRFNYVNISPDAPEFSELIPVNKTNKLREWWYFLQDDFHPFSE